jgi:N-acetylmuramoyl-L-alanine amidase
MKQLKYIIIHCSDSEWGSAAAIREWHLKNGWRDIGYHFVILNGRLRPTISNWQKELTIPLMDGSIEVGRYLDGDNFISSKEAGAHTLNYNSVSIGICLIGKHSFTEKQFYSLELLLKSLLKIYKKDKSCIKGHYHFAKNKTCPNFDVDKFVKERI